MVAPGIMGKSFIRNEEIVERVFSAACDYYGCGASFFKQRTNERRVVEPRHIVIYLLRKETTLTVKEIGTIFNVHYSTVINSSRIVEGRLSINDEQTVRAVSVISGLILEHNLLTNVDI